MTALHWRVVLLLAWLTFVFNIGRIYIDNAGKVNLTPATYIVTLAAALLPLMPFFLKRSLLVLVPIITAAYIGGILLSSTPIFGDIYTYLTLAGAFLVLTTLLLSYRVGQAIEEFRNAVEMITFSDHGRRLQNMKEAQEMVDIEMSRSRRAERPLSVMIFQADISSLNMAMHRLVQEVQRAMIQRYVLTVMAKVLSRCLRRTDVIFEDSNPNRLVLLAPEVGGPEAAQVGQRIRQIVQERLGIAVNFGFATFPQQAVTFEVLLQVAEQHLNSQALVVAEATALETEVFELKEPNNVPLSS